MEHDPKMTDDDVVICIEGNGARPSHKGNGWFVGEAMYTLNTTEIHCVCHKEKENEHGQT